MGFMRQYVWYSPEFNAFVFQTIVDGCEISFEWHYIDMINVNKKLGFVEDPLGEILWIPLGEL